MITQEELKEKAEQMFKEANIICDGLVETKYFEDQEKYKPRAMFLALTMLQKQYKLFMQETFPDKELGRMMTDKLEKSTEDFMVNKLQGAKNIRKLLGSKTDNIGAAVIKDGKLINLPPELARKILETIGQEEDKDCDCALCESMRRNKDAKKIAKEYDIPVSDE